MMKLNKMEVVKILIIIVKVFLSKTMQIMNYLRLLTKIKVIRKKQSLKIDTKKTINN